jgi:hypothetical protein
MIVKKPFAMIPSGLSKQMKMDKTVHWGPTVNFKDSEHLYDATIGSNPSRFNLDGTVCQQQGFETELTRSSAPKSKIPRARIPEVRETITGRVGTIACQQQGFETERTRSSAPKSKIPRPRIPEVREVITARVQKSNFKTPSPQAPMKEKQAKKAMMLSENKNKTALRSATLSRKASSPHTPIDLPKKSHKKNLSGAMRMMYHDKENREFDDVLMNPNPLTQKLLKVKSTIATKTDVKRNDMNEYESKRPFSLRNLQDRNNKPFTSWKRAVPNRPFLVYRD